MDYQRQLLAELMKPLLPSKHKDFRDPDVCKNFLVNFCPHEVFLNTRVGLGHCDLLHDEKLQKDYQASQDRGRLGYEPRFYDLLQKLVADVDRTVRKAHMRLEMKPEVTIGMTQDEIREKVIILEETIRSKPAQVEAAAASGNVQEALDISNTLDRLVLELINMRQNDQTHPSYRPDRTMEVCDICGAMLANDATGSRADAHLTGKQHNGFIKIREALEECKKSGLNNWGRGGDRDRDFRDRDRDLDRDRDFRDRGSRDRDYRRDSGPDRRSTAGGYRERRY